MTIFFNLITILFIMKNDNFEDDESSLNKSSLVTFNVVVLIAFLVLVAGVYFWVSKKNKGEVVFPAGINYLSPNSGNNAAQSATIDFAKIAKSSNWISFTGKVYKYTFLRPKELLPLSFPNDSSESVTFKVSSTPPELNLMLLVETISARNKDQVGKPVEFVKNYYKYFSGLKGLNSFSEFKNDKGLEGYKVTYSTKANTVTTDNYFFVIKGDDDHMIHVANIFPKEGDAVFQRILNSLDYKK